MKTVAADITTRFGRSAAPSRLPATRHPPQQCRRPAPGRLPRVVAGDWIDALDTMMLSPIEMMRLTVDGMMARGFGRVVNIVSRSVKIPQPSSASPTARALASSGLSPGSRGKPLRIT